MYLIMYLCFLKDLLATYQTWKVEAQAACNGDENSDRGPSLKTIEKLISDAESFPIDMTEVCYESVVYMYLFKCFLFRRVHVGVR